VEHPTFHWRCSYLSGKDLFPLIIKTLIIASQLNKDSSFQYLSYQKEYMFTSYLIIIASFVS
jgi:hypothetical protein